MPKCKNDPSRNYKGDEPSPKGLGFCAHAEKEGLTKKGNDGNIWIVKRDKNERKRWVKATKEEFNDHIRKIDKSITEKSKESTLHVFYQANINGLLPTIKQKGLKNHKDGKG